MQKWETVGKTPLKVEELPVGQRFITISEIRRAQAKRKPARVLVRTEDPGRSVRFGTRGVGVHTKAGQLAMRVRKVGETGLVDSRGRPL